MNIIVIVLDSLRADHLGCYGGKVAMPSIDELAADATVFENAYSENMPTLPCRAAWWTGRHLFTRRGWQPFEHTDTLLAEVLSSQSVRSTEANGVSARTNGRTCCPWTRTDHRSCTTGLPIAEKHTTLQKRSQAWRPTSNPDFGISRTAWTRPDEEEAVDIVRW